MRYMNSERKIMVENRIQQNPVGGLFLFVLCGVI
jgi:hypothetical protein